ncbi:unnamed protein product [Sympodiomycopsis kandeliae]
MPGAIPKLTSDPLPSGGGFFLPSSEPAPRSGAHASLRDTTETIQPTKLSSVQLTRLRTHLDAKILSIQRRFSKRFHRQDGASTEESTEPPLSTLASFIDACRTDLLPIVFRIEPVGAQQTSTVVAYAMNLTELLTQGVLGYPCLDDPVEINGESSAHDSEASSFYKLLHVLHLIDALWSALLMGRACSLQLASERAHLQVAAVSPSRRAGLPRPSSVYDTHTILGSLGSKTCTITDRVRLRNLLLTRKQEVEDWLGGIAGVTIERQAADETAAFIPMGEGSRKRRRGDEGSDGPTDRRRKRAEEVDGIAETFDETSDADEREGDGESDLEEVTIQGTGSNIPNDPTATQTGDEDGFDYPKTEEQIRYDALFSRRIDPDSDSDSGDGEDDDIEEAAEQDGSDERYTSPNREEAIEAVDAAENAESSDAVSDGDESAASEVEDPTSIRLPTDSLQLQTLTSRLFARSFNVMERLFSDS